MDHNMSGHFSLGTDCDHSRVPAATGDRATLQPQAWFPQSLMGTGSREVSQPQSL